MLVAKNHGETRSSRCPTRPSPSPSMSRAEALRKDLHRALRSGRATRKPRARAQHRRRSRIPEMVNISERPRKRADRAVPGQLGGRPHRRLQAKAARDLVERSTRFVMLLKLTDAHTAEEVRRAMTKRIKTLPMELRRSVTWDQGNEMALHRRVQRGDWGPGLFL